MVKIIIDPDRRELKLGELMKVSHTTINNGAEAIRIMESFYYQSSLIELSKDDVPLKNRMLVIYEVRPLGPKHLDFAIIEPGKKYERKIYARLGFEKPPTDLIFKLGRTPTDFDSGFDIDLRSMGTFVIRGVYEIDPSYARLDYWKKEYKMTEAEFNDLHLSNIVTGKFLSDPVAINLSK